MPSPGPVVINAASPVSRQYQRNRMENLIDAKVDGNLIANRWEVNVNSALADP